MLKSDDKRVMVEFIRNCSPYRAGERAAFQPAQAEKLISRGLAKVYREERFESEEFVRGLTEEEKAALEQAEGTGDEEKGNGDDESHDDDGSSEQGDSGDGEGEAEEQPKPKSKKSGKSKSKKKRTKL